MGARDAASGRLKCGLKALSGRAAHATVFSTASLGRQVQEAQGAGNKGSRASCLAGKCLSQFFPQLLRDDVLWALTSSFTWLA